MRNIAGRLFVAPLCAVFAVCWSVVADSETPMSSTCAASGSQRLEPVMWADVPDVAPLRVGDTYYMVSTTMHFNPGIPVMASKDLVNWKIVSYCYQTVEDRAKDRLENGEDDYMLGTWASSIRYNEADGFFYVTSFNNKVNATYLFRTKDPTRSNWEFFRLTPKQYDESLWIEDGRFYVFATVPGRPYKVRLTEMKPDFSGFVDEGKIILENVTDCAGGSGLGEGTQVFRRNGWCYIVNIGWPKGSCRTVIVHRARSWNGPWEGKIVFVREGIAQGSFLDRPDGSWVAVLFGDRGAVGRIPYILETEWKDDWPVVQPREVKDAAGKVRAKVPGCVASDEFDGAALKLEWQWNHNPDNANWSLSERPGWMRLKAGRVDSDLLHARNTLTQRTFGPACEGETCLDVTGLKEGDVAGLALLQKLYGLAAVRVNGGKKELVLWSPDHVPSKDKQNTRIGRRVRERERVALPPGTEKVYLKAVCDFTPAADASYTGIPASTDMGKFYYSFDGKGWVPFGDAFDLVYTIPHFIGYRFGLVCFSTKEEGVGGVADFDYLRLAARDDAPFTSDGSIPFIRATSGGLENGGVWRDTDGVHINAHGGGLLHEGDFWYWYGEHKIEGKAGNRAQVGVGCYSSKELLAWKNEGIALAVSETPGDDIEKGCILERPKVVKVPATGKYVMLFHLERKGRGYGDARVGFAVADSPTGPFEFKYSCRPLGAMSRDMTVFTDDDGTVWHIFASEQNSTLHFAELRGDCLGYSGRWHKAAVKEWTEAPAIIKRGGWYWLLGSGCTGWKPNAARIYRAKSLEGPWEWLGNPCTGVNPANKLGADKTWGGQSTYIFHDPATGRDIACFDIWKPSNAIDGRYAWLTITWYDDALLEIPWRDEWSHSMPADGLTLRGGPNSVFGVYQWGVDVDGGVHRETGKPARAYLWIPPKTKRVKAVVIGNDNMLEEPLFSNPDFRRTLASADVAIVFVTPGLQGFNEKFDEGDVSALDALLGKLARASGHQELAKEANLVPLGHSAWADWPYLCTAAMPSRVKCAVSLKGSWPHFKPQFDDAFWKKTEGVPMLLIGGDYEWFSERMDKEKNFLKSHPNVKLYPVADWESGHFDMTDALPLAMAEFIVKGTVPKIPRFGGKFCVLGFRDRDGKIVEQNPKSHLQVTVPFQPHGEGFRATACFDDKVPPGRPERWTGKKAGEPNGKPELPASAIDIKVIQGPAVKTGPDTFDIRFNRHGFDGYRAREVVLAAVYPGDAHWRRSVQQAILRFPKNTHGAENVIDWNPPKTAARADFPLRLDAKASSGLPVRYYVREGPAVVGDDGVLWLCDWPVGAKDCDITVCAYQWGADGGKVKTAKSIYATIRVVR